MMNNIIENKDGLTFREFKDFINSIRVDDNAKIYLGSIELDNFKLVKKVYGEYDRLEINDFILNV